MSKTTPATLALTKTGVPFTLATYEYDPTAERVGLQAAEALGVPPSMVLKTLMAEVDGKPVCVVVPSDDEVSMKKLAAAFGGKSAQMMKPDAAERLKQIGATYGASIIATRPAAFDPPPWRDPSHAARTFIKKV